MRRARVHRPIRLAAAGGATWLLLAGCGFDLDLGGRGYTVCDPAWGCAAPCSCSAAVGVCLPPPGGDRRACQALGPVSADLPGDLPGLPWGDPASTLDLRVTTPEDEDGITAERDLASMRLEAEGGAGLSLREALRLARGTGLPVRIRFLAGAFGAARPIRLGSGLPPLSGVAVLLDGRGAEVILEPAAGMPAAAPGLSITGQVVAVVALTLRDFGAAGVMVSGARAVLLAGLVAQGNTTGVIVTDGSQAVTLGDGSELLDGQGLGGCVLQANVAGLRVVGTVQAPVTDVSVYASELAANQDSGASLSGALERVTIGPPPGRDELGLAGNRIVWNQAVSQGAGVHLQGVRGEVLVRGNLFLDNPIDVRADSSAGDLWMLHNSSLATQVALLKVYGSQGGGVEVLRVRMFNHASSGTPSEHVYCDLRDPGQLDLQAGELLTDQPELLCVCEPACGQWLAGAPVLYLGVNPALVECDGWYCLTDSSPGQDGGSEQTAWDGLGLDLNGPAAGAFCGEAPDIGANEQCE
ncbi:MAG TPA: hypothetical protein PK668_17105 [Myxococcota bacterium]|nr:hypothetical protein [Myxococcota bacterium]HRY94879.1 hypothetical protein [Myxococcota bacterium]HSA24000.1 hypothetical protein [Myxococcota bacterium]